ncbi:MAG TPA: PTS system mannose/fructose/sorbose family transporter subunit IID [Longimicrobium sp.]|nr:PTS system mannose/fructose/sorbose family transporter subunit IID [Longimicrobium sp.]
MSAPAPSSLPLGVRLRVFLRSFFLQASWNPQGMQNLGLAYALYPALKHLYPEPEQRIAAVRRHLVFFNTHPYVAAAIVGGVLHHEERIARGEEGVERVVAFKAALMGPLAAVGDGFFWLSLKPAAGALCAALVPWLHAWAAVLFLFIYNLVHFTLRARLYRTGLRMGDRLVEVVARANLPVWGGRLRTVAAGASGALGAHLALKFGDYQHGSGLGPLLAAGCLGMGVLSYWLVAGRLSGYVLLYLAAGLAAVAGMLL